MEPNVVDLPVELGILWILERFSTVVSSDVVEIAHLVHPVVESIGANLGLVGLG